MSTNNMSDLNGITTLAVGTSGTAGTAWLAEVNPWLAFVSGILTICFMGLQIHKHFKQ
tara:strand:- start:1670 stop:1843 length:174 start_codon:yes stop_codon:yes gene_type:complete